MPAGSWADAVTCAQTMRSSSRPFKDKRRRRETRSASVPPPLLVRFQALTPVFQVKKLQVMLRQANEELERTMTDKQNLEDSVQAGNKETAAKVWKVLGCFWSHSLQEFPFYTVGA